MMGRVFLHIRQAVAIGYGVFLLWLFGRIVGAALRGPGPASPDSASLLAVRVAGLNAMVFVLAPCIALFFVKIMVAMVRAMNDEEGGLAPLGVFLWEAIVALAVTGALMWLAWGIVGRLLLPYGERFGDPIIEPVADFLYAAALLVPALLLRQTIVAARWIAGNPGAWYAFTWLIGRRTRRYSGRRR